MGKVRRDSRWINRLRKVTFGQAAVEDSNLRDKNLTMQFEFLPYCNKNPGSGGLRARERDPGVW
jgi:hypothetical protein